MAHNNQDDTTKETEVLADKTPETPPKRQLKDSHKHVWQWALGHKQISIPLAVVLLLAAVLLVPLTRYSMLGLFLKQTLPVMVLDAQTHKPVSSATVLLAGKSTTTNGEGKATLKVPVGKTTLTVTKRYYKSFSRQILVPVKKPGSPVTVTFEATGRQVPISVLNALSGKPVRNAVLSAASTQVRTDDKGQAVMVVPADQAELAATITVSGFNDASVKLKATAAVDPANIFKITPKGKLYFLSNKSGKLDVVKSNLDGSERTVVLPGTGKEDKPNTVLLASRDWKYIALLSKRDGGENAKLFLIETDGDKVSTMDEGDAQFSLYGWSGDRFVYAVNRNKYSVWQPKQQALKSFQAPTKKLVVLDETTAAGDGTYNYTKESLGDVYILDKEVVFTKGWGGAVFLGDRHATFNSIQSDGSQRKMLKAYPSVSTDHFANIQTRPGELGEIYIQYYSAAGGKSQYDAYQDGALKAESLTDDQYSEPYETYIVSPSGNKTFWTEFRDGKNVFFAGDGKGENGKELGTAPEEYAAYGWYSDDYLLLTKKGSEMRIMPVGGLEGGIEATFKVSDYYKPNYFIRGYGYGYGG